MEYGIVYLLTNPVMPGLVKIGMTTQEDIERRMRELYTTGVPVPFECQFACKDLMQTIQIAKDEMISEKRDLFASYVTACCHPDNKDWSLKRHIGKNIVCSQKLLSLQG